MPLIRQRNLIDLVQDHDKYHNILQVYVCLKHFCSEFPVTMCMCAWSDLVHAWMCVRMYMHVSEGVTVLLVVQNRALGTVSVGLTQVFFTGIAALIMDRAGRKVLLCISGT